VHPPPSPGLGWFFHHDGIGHDGWNMERGRGVVGVIVIVYML
jgi:hypothetical protein